MSKRPSREPAALHRAPFRLDVGVARVAVAATQVIIAELLQTGAPAAPAKTEKLRTLVRAHKRATG